MNRREFVTTLAAIPLVGMLPMKVKNAPGPCDVRAKMRELRKSFHATHGRFPKEYTLGMEAADEYEADVIAHEGIGQTWPRKASDFYFFGTAKVMWSADLAPWAITVTA
jgi:hypothetical protein